MGEGAGAGGDVEGFIGVDGFAARAFGAEEREDGGDGGGVAELAEDAGDAVERDGGEEIFQVGVDDDVAFNVRRGVGDGAAGGDEAVGGVVGGDSFEDVCEDPLLGGGEVFVGSGEVAGATGFFGDGEADVVGDTGSLGVVGEPAQAGDGEIERLGEVGGRGEDGEVLGLEFFEVGSAVGQPFGDAAAEEVNVGLLALGNGFGAEPLAFGSFGLLLLLEALALFAIEFDGLIGGVVDAGEVGADLLHLVADAVDFGELLGGDEALSDHGAVDDIRARIGCGWDEIAAAEEGVAPGGADAGGEPGCLGAGDGGEVGGVEGEGVRLDLRRRGCRRAEAAAEGLGEGEVLGSGRGRARRRFGRRLALFEKAVDSHSDCAGDCRGEAVDEVEVVGHRRNKEER